MLALFSLDSNKNKIIIKFKTLFDAELIVVNNSITIKTELDNRRVSYLAFTNRWHETGHLWSWTCILYELLTTFCIRVNYASRCVCGMKWFELDVARFGIHATFSIMRQHNKIAIIPNYCADLYNRALLEGNWFSMLGSWFFSLIER